MFFSPALVFATELGPCSKDLTYNGAFEIQAKPIIDTARLELRTLQPGEDSKESLGAVLNDPKIKAEWIAAGLWNDDVVTKTYEELSKGATHWGEPYNAIKQNLVIVEKSSGKIVGLFHSTLFSDIEKIGIGFELIESARGKGYATESVRGYLSYLEIRERAHFFAATFQDNEQSINVLRKTGFEQADRRERPDGKIDLYFVRAPSER